MVSSVKKGKAAEYFVAAKALLLGYDCYQPFTEDSKVDLIINNWKIQVKVIGGAGNCMNTRKVSCNSRTNTKVYQYSNLDVDFFAAVQLSSLRVAIVPIDIVVKYTSSISFKTLMVPEFEDRFDLLA